MKSHPAPARAPEVKETRTPATKETEFFRRDHHDPIPNTQEVAREVAPPAPTTEKEIAAREVAPPIVTRTDHAPAAPLPSPSVTLPSLSRPTVAGAVLAPDGRETETRGGVRYIKGTEIVVGGPTQQ